MHGLIKPSIVWMTEISSIAILLLLKFIVIVIVHYNYNYVDVCEEWKRKKYTLYNFLVLFYYNVYNVIIIMIDLTFIV